jgi:hypothetical protein
VGAAGGTFASPMTTSSTNHPTDVPYEEYQ